MTESRTALVQFCDDIRQELGNKYSLMGCYGHELIISKIPAALPKLCAQVSILTPFESPFVKLILRAFLDDELLSEIPIPEEELARGQAQMKKDPFNHRILLLLNMTFSPLFVEHPSRIRIEAETESGILKCGNINIIERARGNPTIDTQEER